MRNFISQILYYKEFPTIIIQQIEKTKKDKKDIIEILQKYLKNTEINKNIINSQIDNYKEIYELYKHSYLVDVETIYPGAIIWCNTFQILGIDNGLAIDFYSNAPYIPATSIKGTFLRAIRKVILEKEENSNIKRLLDEIKEDNKNRNKLYKLIVFDGIVEIKDTSKLSLSNYIEIVDFCKHDSLQLKKRDSKNKEIEDIILVEDLIEELEEDKLKFKSGLIGVEPLPFFMLKIKENVTFKILIIIDELNIDKVIDTYENLVMKNNLENKDYLLDIYITYYLLKIDSNKKKLINKLFKIAFEELGLGSRTSCGFGYFKVKLIK